MHTYRIETILIVISLGALLFVLGSVVQAIAPRTNSSGAAAQTLSVPVSTKIQDTSPRVTARPASCVPLPAAATPGPDSPSPTPALIVHRYDLAPNLAQDQKSSVLVLRCDGSWDQYWLAPAQVLDPQKELKAGDIIFSASPPAAAPATQAPEPTRLGTPTGPAVPSAAPTVRPAVPVGTPTFAVPSATPSGYPAPQTVSTQPGYPNP